VRAGAVTVSVVDRVAPSVAEIVTLAFTATPLVVMLNDAWVALAGTLTEMGTAAAAGVPLVSPTLIPPAGAAPESVTVPVEEVPPVTELGSTLTAVTVGAFTVRVAVRLAAPSVAVMTTFVSALAGVVVMVKLAVELLAGTNTGDVTPATPGEPLEIVTLIPDGGAGAESVTVPVLPVPL
jgi:hypothetical protein